MTRVIISGACGKMGRVLEKHIRTRDDMEIVAGIDARRICDVEHKIFAEPGMIDVDADVLIDFSHPDLLDSLLDFCIDRNVAAVLCTTGYTPEQVEKIKQASKKIPVFFSGNMSMGVNLLIELSKKAASVLGGAFDIEIVEKHHNQKIDAPSGTALMVAGAVSESLKSVPKYVYGRHEKQEKRGRNEIGIHSVRGGTIVGEHEVIFAGNDEILTISHSAQSKEIFAQGAINAALFLSHQGNGLYSMPDMLK